MNCPHFDHRDDNGVRVGRLTRWERPGMWEPCSIPDPAPLPDGFCSVTYACTGCQHTVVVLSFFREFPTGDGFFHHHLDQEAAMELLSTHLRSHRLSGQNASFRQKCGVSPSAG